MFYNIEYTKVFTDGNLKGTEYNDVLTNTTEVVLDRLKARERLNEVITAYGGSNYTIKNVRGFPLPPM